MRFIFLPFIFCTLVLSCTRQEPQQNEQSRPEPRAVERKVERTNDRVPAKAIEVLRHIQSTGRPPRGYVGGRVWENRERRLPAGGQYHEYDVNPKIQGQNRGAERLIVDEQTGKAWYTGDHYRTFILIEE
jgi:ribonuclease T1